ncbi:MAG: sigma-54 dependent transcriptional regulator [Bacteroidales bacterium]|nr:sigma-54 dependent transcriptional regulator [Bacteroidales bacterium]
MASKILVVDDEALIRQSLRDIFEYEGYEVAEAADGRQALAMLGAEAFAAVFCDIKMPGLDGVGLLEKMPVLAAEAAEKGTPWTPSPFIMISGHGDIETAVDCLKKGAFDYLPKPLDLNRVLGALRRAIDNERLTRHAENWKRAAVHSFEMVGRSKALTEVLAMADKVAATTAKVLIEGENGTGKELLARRIHEGSGLASGPWVTVNCAAIPSELIESELFGHEKGAFTSAVKQRKGRFEQADGGTLFLDEIGDMSLAAQAKMLRVLQDRRITRVGGEKEIEVQVRVVAATNKRLETEIAEGRFREDLYHRLSVVKLRMPPLRERPEDIPLLVESFVAELSADLDTKPLTFKKEALQVLQKQPWPGNIRQLRNVVERLLIFCEGAVTAADVEKYL